MIDGASSGGLLSLDPAYAERSKLAVAHWWHGVLMRAHCFKPASGDSLGHRTQCIATQVVEWIRANNLVINTYVYEWPQVYRASKSKGDPNQLIALAAVGAAIGAGLVGARVVSVLPDEWSGQVPKKTTGDPWATPRGIRVASRLSDYERACVPKVHDAIDAVGIGLHALGRYAPRRVFPGAAEG